MLTQVDIQNYRSIYKASVPLSPFTLLIGANGTGKSNFLKLLKDASETGIVVKNLGSKPFPPLKHYAFPDVRQLIIIKNDRNQVYEIRENGREPSILPELKDVKIFSLEPSKAGLSEHISPQPKIEEDGTGIVQVLDSLKTGDREDLFALIEDIFRQHIPEIEKLSFIPGNETKTLQVRERHIPKPVPVKLLSEGTQLVLMLIALLYQERKPSLVCIEDIDRGLHPRLFQRVLELCSSLSQGVGSVQIIATTHSPYIVDQFKDHEESVVIVEKDSGQTKFTTLEERLETLDPDDVPLGSLWYSGFVGGVPNSRR